MTNRGTSLAVQRQVSLVEILDRALGAGVVITGDLTISLAEVDLIRLDLRLILGSVGTIRGERDNAREPDALSVGRPDEDWP